MRIKIFLIMFMVALIARAQTPGSRDIAFQTPIGTDQVPSAILHANGKILVTGAFTTYAGVAGKAAIARLNTDGTFDPSFTAATPVMVTPAVIVNGNVIVPERTSAANITGAAVRPDGKIVVVGDVSHFGAVAFANSGVGLLNADGSVAAFASARDTIKPRFVLNTTGNSVYISGENSIDGATRISLLRLNEDGSRDNSFTPPTIASLGYQSANVFALAHGQDGKLHAQIAAAVNNAVRIEIIRLNSDGSLDTTFADAGHANCAASQFLKMGADIGGRILLTGPGTYRGSTLQAGLNRLTPDGALDASFVPPANLGTAITAAIPQPDGKYLVLGSTLAPVVRLNANGSRDTAYGNPGVLPTQLIFFSVTRLAVAPDNSSYVVATTFNAAFQTIMGVFHIFGDPNSAPTITLEPVAQTNTLGSRTRFTVQAQGAAPLTYQWFRGANSIPNSNTPDLIIESTIATDDADYRCVVSNDLGSAPSATVHLYVWAPTPATLYRETDVPAGPDAQVADLILDSQNRLHAGGYFAKWNNTPRVRAARLLPNSVQLDTTFNTGPNTGQWGDLRSILPLANDRALAIGSLSLTYAGVEHIDIVRLAANGSLDITFNPAGAGPPPIDGAFAQRPALGADGKVVLFADRWNAENLVGSFLRLNEDGTRDNTFALRNLTYFALSGAVEALADGRYLIAAKPTQPGPAGSGIMRLDANGTVDNTFHFGSPYTRVEGPYDILVQLDGKILVAGDYTIRVANTEYHVGLIRLLPDGQPDPEFNPVPSLSARSQFNFAGLRHISLQSDGKIVAIGRALPYLFRFWQNGLLDPSFDLGANPAAGNQATVDALAVRSTDNTIFVGGSFNTFLSLPRTNFVRINGGPLAPAPTAPTIAEQSHRIVARAGSTIDLTVTPAGAGPFQFQWRRNESIASTTMIDLPDQTNATLRLAGLRLQPQDSGLFQVAVVNQGGAIWSQLITLLVEPDPIVAGSVDTSLSIQNEFVGILTSQEQVFAPAPNGQLYGIHTTTIARYHEDGTRDTTFVPPADLLAVNDGGISAIYRQSNGKILIAGRLRTGMLARLNEDGSYDPAFNRNNGYTGFAQNVPWAIAVQSSGKILVGGTFENVNGQEVTGLLRFGPNGSIDNTFPLTDLEARITNPARTLPGTVISIRMLADDRFYIGGGFSHVRGVVRHGIARLNADGSLDTTFVPPTNGASNNGTAGNMLMYQAGPLTADNGIYIFGLFHPYPESPNLAALRLGPTGAIDTTFILQTDFAINYGAVQADGKLIIAGQYTTINGQSYNNIARINLNGSLDNTWNPAGTGNGIGITMAILPDGKLQFGNRRIFTGVGATPPETRVDFTLTANGLRLAWPAGYALQRATNLLPPNWETIAVPNPYVAPTAGAPAFFRLIQTP